MIVGGGWIGLEVAAAARSAGASVTVLESLDLPLLRVLGPEVAQVFADLHREHGVDLRTGVQVAGDRRSDGAGSRRTPGRRRLARGGPGRRRHRRRAQRRARRGSRAGDVDNGIRVDARLRSSDPDVYAAGDVANADHPVLGRRIRVEHWDTAIEQGKTAARGHARRTTAAYDRCPTSSPTSTTSAWSTSAASAPRATTGWSCAATPRGGRVFTAWWLRGGQVVAGMHANDWDAIDHVRAIVGTRVDPGRLGDTSLSLEDLAKG